MSDERALRSWVDDQLYALLGYAEGALSAYIIALGAKTHVSKPPPLPSRWFGWTCNDADNGGPGSASVVAWEEDADKVVFGLPQERRPRIKRRWLPSLQVRCAPQRHPGGGRARALPNLVIQTLTGPDRALRQQSRLRRSQD